ncbi:MAG: tRNA (adenosine(37)-N6)-threonylcarbamoyltransferase complex transferase subunit TsaD [Firmicutes bacterium]|nr:tRNA (adenosine(37)-N6)-threonylcarbamoyltransferase complex transferase subunit TsaD [Bacillota bacterium]
MNYEQTTFQKFQNLKIAKDVVILGIETSCDETSVSVVKNGREMLSNVISSQIEIHRRFGGVVPEIASRNHVMAINSVIDEALAKANLKLTDIDAIGVTYAPGLLGALIVGVSAAKALSYALNIPLIKVNHIHAHVFANYIEHHDLVPPFLSIVASGGHTIIANVETHNDFEILGQTTDDAIGEAFDKVARVLGLPYPGGPEIEKHARLGVPNIDFFKTKKGTKKDLNLSYSGLKTAVINYVNTQKQGLSVKCQMLDGIKITETCNLKPQSLQNICASFQRVSVDILLSAVKAAIKKNSSKTIVLAGGVAANSFLKESLALLCDENNISLKYPSPILCTDNGAMIASNAYFLLKEGKGLTDFTLNAKANLQ